MKELLDFATDLATRAGAITLEYYRTGVRVESKSDDSPVTIADRRAEEFMRAEIEKRFPDDGIVGEEFGDKHGTSGRRWIMDPIDGTKTFIRSVPLYGTMLAVEVNGRAEIGVIRYAATDETLAAMTGGGCFLNGERCHVSEAADAKSASVMMTSLDHFLQFLGEKPFLDLIRSTGIQRTWGDCYGYLLVATGRADAMIDPIVNWWDIAAAIPIIREAGGRLTDRDGKESDKPAQVIASNGRIHDALVAILKRGA